MKDPLDVRPTGGAFWAVAVAQVSGGRELAPVKEGPAGSAGPGGGAGCVCRGEEVNRWFPRALLGSRGRWPRRSAEVPVMTRT